MFAVEVYAAVRCFVFVEGKSQREAARVFGLSRDTVAGRRQRPKGGNMCRFSLPPGYTRAKPAGKPKLGPLLPVIDAILLEDRRAPVKQRHSANRAPLRPLGCFLLLPVAHVARPRRTAGADSRSAAGFQFRSFAAGCRG